MNICLDFDLIYSLFMSFKTCMTLFCGTQKKILWRMFLSIFKKNILLYRFGTAWRWINDDRIYYWLNYPFNELSKFQTFWSERQNCNAVVQRYGTRSCWNYAPWCISLQRFSGETRICKLDQESQICNFTEVRENWWNYFLIGCNLTKTVALGETKIILTTELWRTQGKWSVAPPRLKSTHSWKTWKKVLIFKDICLHSIKQNALDTCHHTFANSLTVI